MQKEISVKRELVRKSIHIITSIIPLVYYYYNQKDQILILCVSLFILFLTGDLLRVYVIKMKQIYEKVFGKLLREKESGKGLNGATLLFLGFSITILLFERNIAIVAMLFLSISDTVAAIIGKSFGRIKIFNKTFEGALAFFVSAFIISLIFYDRVILGLLIAIIMAIIELAPIKINDNITIPLATGILFTLANNV
jgi:dolichol kinase